MYAFISSKSKQFRKKSRTENETISKQPLVGQIETEQVHKTQQTHRTQKHSISNNNRNDGNANDTNNDNTSNNNNSNILSIQQAMIITSICSDQSSHWPVSLKRTTPNTLSKTYFCIAKSARRTFFPNLSKCVIFAAAPLVLTPFVRNQVFRIPPRRRWPHLLQGLLRAASARQYYTLVSAKSTLILLVVNVGLPPSR